MVSESGITGQRLNRLSLHQGRVLSSGHPFQPLHPQNRCRAKISAFLIPRKANAPEARKAEGVRDATTMHGVHGASLDMVL